MSTNYGAQILQVKMRPEGLLPVEQESIEEPERNNVSGDSESEPSDFYHEIFASLAMRRAKPGLISLLPWTGTVIILRSEDVMAALDSFESPACPV